MHARKVGLAPEGRYHDSGEGLSLHERSQFLRELEAIFSQSVPVPSACLSIEGGWGAGKSALFDATCRIATRSACQVLRARGGELEKRAPLEVLGRFIELASSLPSGNERIWERARALQATMDEATTPDVVAIGASFYLLLVALRHIGPVLLAIDDADLVDRETLTVLQYVFHRIENQQIWLLITSHPRFPGSELRAVDWLLMESHPRQFLLEPLNADSVKSVIAEYLGEDPDPAFVAACYAATGGNPLFLVALVSSCGQQRIRPSADMAYGLERRSVPKISQMVLCRLARMPVAATDLLQACAILGDTADLQMVHRLAKIDALAAERAADTATQMELLGVGRPIAFSAPVIRWAIYHDIPRARRSQLHARCADHFSELGAEESAIIEHLVATESTGDLALADRLQRAARCNLEAGDAALAARCLHRAIAENPPAKEQGPLFLDLAHAEMELGRSSALSHFQRALDLDAEDHTEVVRVAIGLLHGLSDRPELKDETLTALRNVTIHVAAVDHSLQIEFELALSLVSANPAERTSSLGKIGALLADDDEAAETVDESAVSQAARTVLHIQQVAAEPGFTADSVAALLETVINPDEMLSPDPVIAALQGLSCYLMLCADQFADVDGILPSVQDRARECGNLRAELITARLMSLSFLWQGSLTEAEEACRRQHELGTRLGSLTVWPVVGLVEVLIGQGRGTEAQHLRDSLRPEGIEEPINRAAAHVECGRLLVERGMHREALDDFLEAGEIAREAGIVNPALLPWRADAAVALASLAQWAEARAIADEHLKVARDFGAPRTIGIGLRAMAATTPNLTERIAWLTQSVEVLEHSPARLEAAGAMIELGTALVTNKQLEEARGILRRGATLASMCGARQLVEEAGAQLRATGARPRRLGSTGLGSLTPSELRVVRLAAASKTNRAIADDLFVSVKTVEGHLAKAYRKLGVTSRRHLAAEFSFAKSNDDEPTAFSDLSPNILGPVARETDDGFAYFDVDRGGEVRGA
jgi:DNA-binding CsgD family transcriptional regulator